MPTRPPRLPARRAAAAVSPAAALPTRPLRAALTAALLSAALLGAGSAAAQPVLGAGEDATIPAPGQARARGVGTLTAYGSTYGEGKLRGLGGAFSTDSFGPTQLPRLTAARDTLRAITGRSNLALSLGRVDVGAYAQTISVPVIVEVGIARRFALGINVPFNRTRVTIAPTVNAGANSAATATGNFGFNPANSALSGSTLAQQARAQNGAVQTNLAGAAAALANVGARALADSVTRFAAGLASVYGDATRAGANAVPLLGSDAQAAVAQQLARLAASAQAAGVTTLDATVVPYAARERIGYTGFRRAVTDSSFGLAATDSLGAFDARRESVGDIEVTGLFQWLDTFGGAGDSRGAVRARVAPAGRRVRSTVVAGFRVGTGRGDVPGFLLEVPPATGANALLLRSITDVAFGQRFSASGSVRLTAPLADTRTLRLSVAPDSGYVPLYRERTVERRLGRELQFELNPRYAIGDAFALWGQALVRDRKADRYAGQYTATAEETGGSPVTFDAATAGIGTAQRESRFGLGIAYSTLAAWSRGRARLPLEVSYLHAVSAAGSGATTPRLSSDVLSLRVYAALRGR